jgi:hypothetical protein
MGGPRFGLSKIQFAVHWAAGLCNRPAGSTIASNRALRRPPRPPDSERVLDLVVPGVRHAKRGREASGDQESLHLGSRVVNMDLHVKRLGRVPDLDQAGKASGVAEVVTAHIQREGLRGGMKDLSTLGYQGSTVARSRVPVRRSKLCSPVLTTVTARCGAGTGAA